eukprot:TRINITY_DN42170_c0_g1_i1.p2 TRINITY_DN42170_c0_g1~~TRINITY_DN42170_c0_g1_i1.p2  ORF type:complete len:231 (-),score=53.56 TRINITY_DN42170_c0_g1_i1:96-788(-)
MLRRLAGLAQPRWTPLHVGRRGIFIQTAPTPNPDCQKYFNQNFHFFEDGRVADFPTATSAFRSPLARQLFQVDGVKSVFIAEDYLSICRDSRIDWDEINPKVYSAITQWYHSGEPLFTEDAIEEEDTKHLPEDSEAVLAIKELLASRIRPMVQRDGGNIRFVKFDEEEGVVYVKMQGACKSCPSSTNTLKGGIERMLLHYVPEVTELREWKDPEEEEEGSEGTCSTHSAN